MARRIRRRRAGAGGRFQLRVLLPVRRWVFYALVVLTVPAIGASVFLGYYYVQFSRLIEARLHGERDRVVPRVFARPLSLHVGQGMSEAELIARLNDVGYAQRSRVERAGEFAVDGATILLMSRGGDSAGRSVRVAFTQ